MQRAKLWQLVNTTIDTKEYFGIKTRLRIYLERGGTPTTASFLRYLNLHGDSELARIVEEHSTRPEIKFLNGQQMYDYLSAGNDLYSPQAQEYLFCYNEEGAVASYRVSPPAAHKLAQEAVLYENRWSTLLGAGGAIYEKTEALAFCEGECKMHRGWQDTEDYERMPRCADYDRDTEDDLER